MARVTKVVDVAVKTTTTQVVGVVVVVEILHS